MRRGINPNRRRNPGQKKSIITSSASVQLLFQSGLTQLAGNFPLNFVTHTNIRAGD
jgi:hypothetical protein